MKKETYLRKAGELYDSILPIQRKIREKSEKYLQMVLAEHDGKIDFDDYDPEEFVSVPYDGGNHPEYASNCFSTVNGVFTDEKGHIYLNIEDCSEYPLTDVDWDDVYNIADYIENQILDIVS
jgi:hypothetical protein